MKHKGEITQIRERSVSKTSSKGDDQKNFCYLLRENKSEKRHANSLQTHKILLQTENK